jgi:predicted nucleic acid-binding OB-fold protein
MIFEGVDSDKICDDILEERGKRKFRNIDDVEKFISAKKRVVRIREDELERIVFS